MALVLALVVVGSGAFAIGGAPSATSPGAASSLAAGPASPMAPVGPALTHGDLVVGPNQTVTIQPTLAGKTYFQGGNITVEAGGTLNIRNVTLSFVQFVSNTGSAESRLSHIDHFTDAGTVNVANSTITTDVAILNAYAKLTVNITGSFDAWGSTLAFPGWVTVYGPGATLTLNQSEVTANPAVLGLIEPATILGDTEYAPAVSDLDGGVVNLFGSTLTDLYANNLDTNGVPTTAPLSQANVAVPGNASTLSTPNDSANLTRDWLYPAGMATGQVQIWYNDTSTAPTTVIANVTYQGRSFPLAPVLLKNGTTGGYVAANFTPGLTRAVDAGGMLSYLNSTGAFGSPRAISIAFKNLSGPSVLASTVAFTLIPAPAYNVNVSGPGSTFNAVDSILNLTWNAGPAQPWSTSSPLPWLSNHLVLTDGATANLANISIPSAIPGVFSTSAIQPDASSHVTLYRWASFQLTGRGGAVPVYGARVAAYYAYPSDQTNNVTANAANNLSTAVPSIWGYVQFDDRQSGFPAYGESGSTGIVHLLLASSTLNGSSLPDGDFLGTYHIGILLPIPTNNSRWFNWSVSPFPLGVALGTAGYGGPDAAPNQAFPQYYAAAAIETAPVVTTSGTPSPTGVRIGQTITFTTTLTSVGPAPITSLAAELRWNSTTPLDSFFSASVPLATQGSTYSFEMSWLVVDNVTGLRGAPFNQSFTVAIYWNPGNATGISGTVNASIPILVRPSQVTIDSTTTVPSRLDATASYLAVYSLAYNGTQPAVVYLWATPASGGARVEAGAESARAAGNVTLSWGASQLTAGTAYTLQLEAVYNGVDAYYNYTGTYLVPATTSPTSFFTQVFFHLMLWIWLVIAAAAVAAIAVALMVLRRTAAGKLVECGECGNLIPEDATVCPKCGAEFESDLVRCSRCASTIPARSTICPECAAVLLGGAGEAGEDAERQGYQDFTEKYRAEAKRELGDNFNEGSFWDWWKRQPTYVPYNQWKLQQGQGTPRTGMTEPPTATSTEDGGAAPAERPPKGGGGGAGAAVPAPPPRSPAAALGPSASRPPEAAPAAPSAGFKACPSCAKEIPADYLICPFCSSVVQ